VGVRFVLCVRGGEGVCCLCCCVFFCVESYVAYMSSLTCARCVARLRVYMYVCICGRACAFMSVHACVYAHVWVGVSAWVNVCAFIFVCICRCVCARWLCLYVRAFVFVYAYVCVYACVYEHACVWCMRVVMCVCAIVCVGVCVFITSLPEAHASSFSRRVIEVFRRLSRIGRARLSRRAIDTEFWEVT
jgi:hypothetical protein